MRKIIVAILAVCLVLFFWLGSPSDLQGSSEGSPGSQLSNTVPENVVYNYLTKVERSQWREAFEQHLTESAYTAYAPYLPELEAVVPDYKRFENLRVYLEPQGEADFVNVLASYTLELRSGGQSVTFDVVQRFTLIEGVDGVYRIVEMENLSEEANAVRTGMAIRELASMALAIERFYMQHGRYPETAEIQDVSGVIRIDTLEVNADPWGKPYTYSPPRQHYCGFIASVSPSGIPLTYKVCPPQFRSTTSIV